mmetsp:Transcript_47678/g.113570  ORF Transcript_47678/g.113570 Transcript_47678/m.113570 type:complete len:322 (+) Transcript_47678:119-1084(+)
MSLSRSKSSVLKGIAASPSSEAEKFCSEVGLARESKSDTSVFLTRLAKTWPSKGRQKDSTSEQDRHPGVPQPLGLRFSWHSWQVPRRSSDTWIGASAFSGSKRSGAFSTSRSSGATYWRRSRRCMRYHQKSSSLFFTSGCASPTVSFKLCLCSLSLTPSMKRIPRKFSSQVHFHQVGAPRCSSNSPFEPSRCSASFTRHSTKAATRKAFRSCGGWSGPRRELGRLPSGHQALLRDCCARSADRAFMFCTLCRRLYSRASASTRKAIGLLMLPLGAPPICAKFIAKSFSAGIMSGLRAMEIAFRMNMEGVTSAASPKMPSIL